MINLIKINNKWWNNGDKTTYNSIPFCDGYTIEEIMRDNRTYNMDLLRELNKFIITTDSQEGGYKKDERMRIIPEFAYFLHDSRGITLDSMEGNYIIETRYVPYLECVTTKKRAYEIYENITDIGIYLLEKDGFDKMNDTMSGMLKESKKMFKLDHIPLTYHKTRHQVFDSHNRIWTNLIAPTLFSKRIFMSDFPHSKIYPKDAVMMFFIGEGDINNIFQKILNVFL